MRSLASLTAIGSLLFTQPVHALQGQPHNEIWNGANRAKMFLAVTWSAPNRCTFTMSGAKNGIISYSRYRGSDNSAGDRFMFLRKGFAGLRTDRNGYTKVFARFAGSDTVLGVTVKAYDYGQSGKGFIMVPSEEFTARLTQFGSLAIFASPREKLAEFNLDGAKTGMAIVDECAKAQTLETALNSPKRAGYGLASRSSDDVSDANGSALLRICQKDAKTTYQIADCFKLEVERLEGIVSMQKAALPASQRAAFGKDHDLWFDAARKRCGDEAYAKYGSGTMRLTEAGACVAQKLEERVTANSAVTGVGSASAPIDVNQLYGFYPYQRSRKCGTDFGVRFDRDGTFREYESGGSWTVRDGELFVTVKERWKMAEDDGTVRTVRDPSPESWGRIAMLTPNWLAFGNVVLQKCGPT